MSLSGGYSHKIVCTLYSLFRQSRLSETVVLGQTENKAQERPEMERARELKSY